MGWRIETWGGPMNSPHRSDVQHFADEEAARRKWALALQPETCAVLAKSTAISERFPVEVWTSSEISDLV